MAVMIEKLENWFMDDSSSGGLIEFVEEFAKAHKDVFDLDQEENKQEYMQIYNEFQVRTLMVDGSIRVA